MKQIIFGAVIALILSGFFVEEAFAQVGSNGGIGGSGTTGSATNGGVSTNGNTTNGKNGTSANGHSMDGSGN